LLKHLQCSKVLLKDESHKNVLQSDCLSLVLKPETNRAKSRKGTIVADIKCLFECFIYYVLVHVSRSANDTTQMLTRSSELSARSALPLCLVVSTEFLI
jgi:hypothetical protein